MLGPTVQNKMLQCEVYGGSNETRTEDEAANLQLETRFAPRVVIHNDATGISSGFEESSDAQGKSVSPCLAQNANDNASEAAKSEESAEEGIGTEIRSVSVERSENRTFRRHFETLAEISLWPILGGGNNDNLCGQDKGSNETFLCVGTHYGRKWTKWYLQKQKRKKSRRRRRARNDTSDTRQQIGCDV